MGEDWDKEGAKAAVEEAVEIISAAELETAGEVVIGLPKKGIVDRAREWNATLVAVGSRGQRNLKRLLLGSVSEFVANHANCSVEVIRHAV